MPGYKGEDITVVVGVGYVGRRLLKLLPERASLGLTRSPRDSNGRIRQIDLDDDEAVCVELPPDYAIVYTVPPARGKDSDGRLRRFLQLLSHPPRRFVYLSTTGVYGNRDGKVIDETATIAPESAWAKLRASAERDLQTFSKQNSVDLVTLRVPGIYGPGRLGIKRLRDGQPVLRQQDANPGNRIHVDDLARCCVSAVAVDVPAGIYNVGDGDERTATWFAEELARQLNIEPPPTVSRKTTEQTFSTRRLSFLRESRRLDLTKMREVLKPHLKYTDAAAGIAASLEEEKS